jgi:hypothetical protein
MDLLNTLGSQNVIKNPMPYLNKALVNHVDCKPALARCQL